MDKDGYPTKAELKKIRKWPRGNYLGLMDYVRQRWRYADSGYFKAVGKKYYFSTAGWSGNEDIIEALRANKLFWAFCWENSAHGGHYIFDLSRAERPNGGIILEQLNDKDEKEHRGLS